MDETPSRTEETIKQNLETQLSELEMLQSVFYNPGEIRFDDPSVVAHITNYIKNKTNVTPPCLDFTVNLTIENVNFEISVTLPHDYPGTTADIFIRNNQQNREQQRKLNTDLTEYVKSLESGDICVYSAVTWLQDNALSYVNVSNETVVKKKMNVSSECARYWIYSHHIYSKTKRREISNLADDYDLTGFCLPGKPGVVCIEGAADDCNNWWSIIKAMCWKKIVIKLIENEMWDDVQQFRKFKKFEELAFQTEGNRGNHMSLGGLVKYLEGHNCGDKFKELFGLEGKNP